MEIQPNILQQLHSCPPPKQTLYLELQITASRSEYGNNRLLREHCRFLCDIANIPFKISHLVPGGLSYSQSVLYFTFLPYGTTQFLCTLIVCRFSSNDRAYQIEQQKLDHFCM